MKFKYLIFLIFLMMSLESALAGPVVDEEQSQTTAEPEQKNSTTLSGQNEIGMQINDNVTSLSASDVFGVVSSGELTRDLRNIHSDAIRWKERGDAQLYLNKYKEALNYYDTSIGIISDDSDAWNGRGMALFALGRHEEALDSYNISLRLNLSNSNAWNNKGITLLILNRYDAALESYNQSLEINSSNKKALSGKTNALMGLGRYEESMEYIRKVTELDPFDGSTWYTEGQILEMLGRRGEANAAYAKAKGLGYSI